MPPSVGALEDAQEPAPTACNRYLSSKRNSDGIYIDHISAHIADNVPAQKTTVTTSATSWTPEVAIAAIPEHQRPTPHTSSPVPFFHLLERLKTSKRAGWPRFGVQRGESIADHMYRMAMITMLAPPSLASRLDIPRCTKMALIHDVAESLVGDITPVDGVRKTEKHRREAATIDFACEGLLGSVHGGVAGEEIREIWKEYEEAETLEAKFVHDVDKMELVLQMVEYEKAQGQNGQIDLGEFSWVAARIVLPEVREWCEEVLKEREAHWARLGKEPSGARFDAERERLQVEYYGNGDTNGEGQ